VIVVYNISMFCYNFWEKGHKRVKGLQQNGLILQGCVCIFVPSCQSLEGVGSDDIPTP